MSNGNPGPSDKEVQRDALEKLKAEKEGDEEDTSSDKGKNDQDDDEEDASSGGEGSSDGEDAEEDADDSSDEGGDGSSSGEFDDDSEEGSDSSDGWDDPDDGPEEDAGESGRTSTGEGGDGASSDGHVSVHDIREEIGEVLDAISEIAEVREEVRRAQDIVETSRNIPMGVKERHEILVDVPVELRSLARGLEKVLRQAETDVDPSWEHMKSHGNLDMRRALGRDPHDETIYKEWKEGNTYGTDQEIVLLLDRSGSMRGQGPYLSAVAWAMKRAADSIGARLTALTFSDDGAIVYEGHQRANINQVPMVGTGGCTTPYWTLMEVEKLFKRSTARHKMLFIMTDGTWDFHSTPGGDSAEKVIQRIRAMGAFTQLFHYMKDIQEENRPLYKNRSPESHGMESSAYIFSLFDMVQIVNDVVRRVILGERKGKRR